MTKRGILKLIYVFVLAVALNFAWENAHAPLYASYKGGAITQSVLFRASVADAVYILLLALIFMQVPFFKKRLWLVVPMGFVISASIEWWGLVGGRWVYSVAMPIIPYLDVGLTPLIQIGVLAYLIFRMVKL